MNTSTDLQANKAFKGKNSKGSKKCGYYNKINHIEANYYIKHSELIPNKSTKKKSKGKGAKESKEESTKALISSFSSTSSSSSYSSTADQAYATIYNYRIVLDSGASEHYTPNKSLLLDYKPVSKKSITIANSDILTIIGRGDIPIITRKGDRVLIKDVNYVPSLKTTLLSSKELTNKDWKVTFNKKEGSKGLKIQKVLDLSDCSAYNSGKIHAISSTKPISDTPPLTVFNIDIAGPFRIKGLKGERYFLTITYRGSRAIWVYALKHKADAYDTLIEWYNMITTQFKGILVRYKSVNNFLVYIPKKRAIISSKNVLIKEDLTFKDEVISKEELESFNKTLNDCETSYCSNRVISLPINIPKSDLSRAENSERIDGETADNSLNKEKVIEDTELDLFNDIAEEVPIVEIPKRAFYAFISSKSDEEIRLSPDPERILIKKDLEVVIYELKSYKEAMNSPYKDY
ncbi:uncharacterized protein RCO7_11731 [Rhynchosporium graminicola]|uniref:Retrovirus-related Pol polyprotein from transposon TNT 1-94-like beta-barrel domain-containing protein n=1 Tax=Rhynchosporium graminicola TaxID=2792576 RepID=A0A1E1LQW2_9HELO|nr:uncharacterized protein RCO7_11731 [Rhynchosporium commune]